MNARTIGALVVAALVLLPLADLIRRTRAETAESAFLEAFPALLRPQQPRVRAFIRDPLLLPAPSDPTSIEYDRAVNALYAAQQKLRAEQFANAQAADKLADAEREVRKAEAQLEEARLKRRLFAHDTAKRRLQDEEASLQRWSLESENAHRQFDATRATVRIAEGAMIGFDAEVRKLPQPATESPLLIERNTILIVFRKGTKAKGVQDVLRRHRLTVRSADLDILLFVTETIDRDGDLSEEGEATRLAAIAESLEQNEASVERANVNAVLGATTIPLRNTSAPRNWFATNPADPLVISKFPEAWNFNAAITHQRAHVDVGVIDVGFLKPASSPTPDLQVNLVGGSLKHEHGTLVAGIIGATFGNASGIDGAAPFVTIQGCASDPLPDLSRETPENRMFAIVGLPMDNYVQCLKTLVQKGVKVINASVAYNWIDRRIEPETLVGLVGDRARKMVKDHGAMVRTALNAASNSVIVVSAAGNDTRQPAKWASPFNWAALGDTSQFDPAAENVIVVEGLGADGASLLAETNLGGTIQAIGFNVPTIAELDASGRERVGFCQDGTSCAAPLVTAAIAQMLAVNSKLTPAKIKTNLGIRNGVKPPLNAFAAVKESASRTELVDYNHDGNVDLTDYNEFKRDFKALLAGQQLGTFGLDLNGDGPTPDGNETRFCRSDLDANGTFDENDLDVMIAVWTDTAIDTTTLKARLRQ